MLTVDFFKSMYLHRISIITLLRKKTTMSDPRKNAKESKQYHPTKGIGRTPAK
jgi:hypothetical protein